MRKFVLCLVLCAGLALVGCSSENGENATKAVEETTISELEKIVKEIDEGYKEIVNNPDKYSYVEEENLYNRYDDENGLRLIVLYPNENELRDTKNEFYYSEGALENGKTLLYAKITTTEGYTSQYYFNDGKVYRYVDKDGKITDYENGESVNITEDIFTVYGNGMRELTF